MMWLIPPRTEVECGGYFYFQSVKLVRNVAMANTWNIERLHLSPYGVFAAAVNEAVEAMRARDPEAVVPDQPLTGDQARELVLKHDFIHALGGVPLARVLQRDEAAWTDHREPLVRLDISTLALALGLFDASGLDALQGPGTGRRAVTSEVARMYSEGRESDMMREMDEAIWSALPRLVEARLASQAGEQLDVALLETLRQLPDFPDAPQGSR